jgi:hypothetical protein
MQAGGWALIGSAIVTIAVMLVHPGHVDTVALLGPFGWSGIVHGFAIAWVPPFVFGAFSLSRFLGLDRPKPLLAFIAFALAGAMMLNAAVTSMFITPAAAAAAASASPGAREALAQMAHISVATNRGFAQVYVALTSFAILLWALAWLDRGNRPLAAAGVAVSLGLIGWQLGGKFEPGTHTMLIVAILQGGWLIAAASRTLPADASSRSPG